MPAAAEFIDGGQFLCIESLPDDGLGIMQQQGNFLCFRSAAEDGGEGFDHQGICLITYYIFLWHINLYNLSLFWLLMHPDDVRRILEEVRPVIRSHTASHSRAAQLKSALERTLLEHLTGNPRETDGECRDLDFRDGNCYLDSILIGAAPGSSTAVLLYLLAYRRQNVSVRRIRSISRWVGVKEKMLELQQAVESSPQYKIVSIYRGDKVLAYRLEERENHQTNPSAVSDVTERTPRVNSV